MICRAAVCLVPAILAMPWSLCSGEGEPLPYREFVNQVTEALDGRAEDAVRKLVRSSSEHTYRLCGKLLWTYVKTSVVEGEFAAEETFARAKRLAEAYGETAGSSALLDRVACYAGWSGAEKTTRVAAGGKYGRGIALYRNGKAKEALGCFRSASETYRPLGDRWMLAYALEYMGLCQKRLENASGAQIHLEECLRLTSTFCDGHGRARVAGRLSRLSGGAQWSGVPAGCIVAYPAQLKEALRAPRDGSPVVSPDGRLRLSWSPDGAGGVWEVRTGRELWQTAECAWMCVDADGNHVATVEKDHGVVVRDARTGHVRRKLGGARMRLGWAAFEPGDMLIACGSRGLCAYGLSDGREVWRTAEFGADRGRVAVSEDGKIVVSEVWGWSKRGAGGYARRASVCVRDLRTGEVLGTFACPPGERWSLRRDGRVLALSQDGVVRFLCLPAGTELWAEASSDFAFSPDGGTVALWQEDGATMLRDSETGDGPGVLRRRGRATRLRRCGVSAGRGEAQEFSPEKPGGPFVSLIEDDGGDVFGVSLSSDGRRLASCGRGPTIRLWDVTSGRRLRTLPVGDGEMLSVCFSPDGRFVAGGGAGGTVGVWEVTSGRNVWRVKGHVSHVNCICFGPHGELVASGGDDAVVSLRRADDGCEVRSCRKKGSVCSLSFSPNGEVLASVRGSTVRLWDVEGDGSPRTLGECQGDLSVAFHPDGDLVAVGGSRVGLYEVDTGKLVRTFEWRCYARNPVALYKEGRSLTAGTVFGGLATGQWHGLVRGGIGVAGPSVSASPDGTLLAVGGGRREVALWDLRPMAGIPSRVALRPTIACGLPSPAVVTSPCSAPSYSQFYAAMVGITGPLAACEALWTNPLFAREFAREMLREAVHHTPLSERKLRLADNIAEMCYALYRDDSLVGVADAVRRMSGERLSANRGMTFLAATHLWTSGDSDAKYVVRTAPELACLFVGECVRQEWQIGGAPLPGDAPEPLKELRKPGLDRIALARRVGAQFSEYYGQGWLAEAAGMAAQKPAEDDPNYLRISLGFGLRCLRTGVDLPRGDTERLSLFVHAALRRGQYGKALLRATVNDMIGARYGVPHCKVLAALDLAEVCRRIGDLAKAADALHNAETIADANGVVLLRPQILIAKAALRQTEGSPEEACRLLRESVRLCTDSGDEEGECRAHALLALADLARGEHARSAAEAELAIGLARGDEMREERMTALYAIATVLARKGKYAEAVEKFRQVVGDGRSGDVGIWVWEALFGIGSCNDGLAAQQPPMSHEARLYRGMAVRSYERALDAVERQRGGLASEAHRAFFSEDKTRLHDSLINGHVSLGQDTDAVRAAERCRAMAFFEGFVPKALSLRRERLGALRAKAQEAAVDAQAGRAVPREVQDLARRVSSRWPRTHRAQGLVLRRLADVYQEAANSLDSPSWGSVRNPYHLAVRVLRPRSVVLEYYLGKRDAYGFAMTRNGVRGQHLDVDPEQIAEFVDAFRDSSADGVSQEILSSDAYQEPLAVLYRILVEPFEAELAECDMLYIVPHGVLHYLPFQALLGADGQFLIERVCVACIPSMNILRYCRATNTGRNDTLLAIANPQTGWDGLPSAEREAASVSALFGDRAEVAMGAAATEELVKKSAGRYDVLTFPTHGEMVWDHPTESNLRFTPTEREDGRLTVREICELDLRASLVVLSACETGLAGGYAGKLPSADDFVGLTRAFMYAGAPSVIGSLWKVADDSAVALMTAFFKNWKDKGMDKAEALRQAQLAMINGDLKLGMVVRGPGGVAQVDAEKLEVATGRNLGRHPYFWAPFVLIGDYK